MNKSAIKNGYYKNKKKIQWNKQADILNKIILFCGFMFLYIKDS